MQKPAVHMTVRAFDGGGPEAYLGPMMSPKQDNSGWIERKPTALLVLADGTVLEGFGLGATGPRGRRGLLQHRDDRL